MVPVKAVQISIDAELLRRIDRDPEVRKRGRSAFVRSAVELYLAAKKRRDVDLAIAKAYQGRSNAMLDEIEDLLGRQAWPEE
jgi:metal-responsive CopG/Arc/MetJ family transcriptional regulator